MPPPTRKGPRRAVVAPLRARNVVAALLKTRQRIHNRFKFLDKSNKLLTGYGDGIFGYGTFLCSAMFIF